MEQVTRQVIYHASFNTDADAARAWYEQQRSGLAAEFELELESCMQRVMERPQTFQLVRGAMRQALLKRFPYAVVFELTDQRILVGGVFHCARNRTMWESRFR